MADIIGTNGPDTLVGTNDRDRISGLEGDDELFGRASDDRLFGGSGDDALYGEGGSDVLDGGVGADQMTGADGFDAYYVDNAGDIVIEEVDTNSGRVLASVSYALGAAAYINILSTNSTAGTGAINLTGNDFRQNIIGNAGANILNGLGDADVMQGLAGDDKYFVDHPGDKIVEAAGGGTDRVLTSISYALHMAAEVEVFSTDGTDGTGAISLAGNDFAQNIIGNAGNNVVTGLGGADLMQGLGGDDKYHVENAGDIVVEQAGQGSDRIYASVTYALGAAAQVEILSTNTTAGTTAINLTGNDFAQNIIGNGGANTLNGLGGADLLQGLDGDDSLRPGADAARDILYGGDGIDVADYADAQSGVTVLFSDFGDELTTGGGAAANDQFKFVESVNGSAFADHLRASDGGHVFGAAGDDALSSPDSVGGSFNLTCSMRGGDGFDFMTGDLDTHDSFWLELGKGRDSIQGFARSGGGDETGQDQLVVSGSEFGIFEILLLNQSSGPPVATAAEGQFIYVEDTEVLWFDSNGTEGGGLVEIASVHIDNFILRTTLEVQDFSLVG